MASLVLPRIVSQQPLPGPHPDKGIMKCKTDDNKYLVKKPWVDESEARMHSHASNLGLKTPRFRGMVVEDGKRSILMDFIPGVTVASVWKQLSSTDQKAILQDLRAEILKMRHSTKQMIGRVSWNEEIATNHPYHDPYFPDERNKTVTSFRSEEDFDQHKIGLMGLHFGDKAAKKYQDSIISLRPDYKPDFVLTHADLHQENVLVHQVLGANGKPCWRLAGIVDWARSGYYPRYMEYATAMNNGPTYKWWQKEMKKVLEGLNCSSKRVKVEGQATSWIMP